MIKWLLVISVIILTAGCRGYKQPIPDQVKYDLSKPVDCNSAREDIKVLEQEKAQVAEQAKAGVKMFVPAAAARSILHGDYLDQKEVATGEYNQAIDDKIKLIKERCGLCKSE